MEQHHAHLPVLQIPWLQPEAVKAVIQRVLEEPLENVGEALAGFKWEYEKVRGQLDSA